MSLIFCCFINTLGISRHLISPMLRLAAVPYCVCWMKLNACVVSVKKNGIVSILMPDLAKKRIVLGLTGGIACYKVAEFLRRMQDQGAVVDVVMTQAATQFITPVTMQALSGRTVFVDAWDNRVP